MITPDQFVVTHPDNVARIRELVDQSNPRPIDQFGRVGIPIRENPMIPRFEIEYRFPRERFWCYEESDREWCEYFGIGCQVETDRPVFYMISPGILSSGS